MPTATTQIDKVILQKDILNTGAATGVECIVAMDADGGLRFYAPSPTVASPRLVGRTTAGTGAYEAISVSSRLRLSAGQLDISDAGVGTTQMDDAAVTTAKLGNLAVTTAKIDAAAVTTAKLADSSVTSAKIVDGTITEADLAFAAVRVLESVDGNPIATVSSTTLATLRSVTIPANTLPGSKVRVVLNGDLTQNSGATQDIQWKFALGATTVHDSVVSTPSSSNKALWRLELELTVPTSGKWNVIGNYQRSAQSVGTTGIGSIAEPGDHGVFGNDNVAEDETSDLALVVQARFATSATSSTIRLVHAEATVT